MKILVGYDGSETSKIALNLAIKHAKVFQAEILLVTSLVGGTETSQEEIQAATEFLEKAKMIFEKEGIPGDVHLLIRGLTPREDIVNFAKDHKADEIIIGLKKRSKMGKLLFGSNAQYVILKAHCPVVSVKPEQEE